MSLIGPSRPISHQDLTSAFGGRAEDLLEGNARNRVVNSERDTRITSIFGNRSTCASATTSRISSSC